MFEQKIMHMINWIHLHFTIVLVLVLIVFMAGIETATDNKVGYNHLHIYSNDV